MGRPSEFSKETVALICERMSEGEGLRKICSDLEMPDRGTVLRWLDKHEEFRHQYARARESMMDYYAEEILEIAWDGSGDSYVDGDGRTRTDHEVVARSRLKVDTLKWLMSKLAPRRYGDKLTTEVTGPGGGPQVIQRVIIGWKDPDPVAPPQPAAQITYDPGPLPARVDPEILVRLVNLIKDRVPRADQRPPEELLEEVMGAIDRALIAEYG
jgi:hypothetical protein